MNTFLSDTDETLRQEFERFAQEKLAPLASGLVQGSTNLIDFYKQLAQAGYLGLNVPSEYGGKGESFLQTALLIEALAGWEVGAAVSLAYHVACLELIKQYASDDQKKTYLPKLSSGALLGTVAHMQDQGNILLVLNEFPVKTSLILVFTGGDFFFLSDLSKTKVTPRAKSMGLHSICFADLLEDDSISEKNLQLGGSKPNSEIAMEKLQFVQNIVKTLLAIAAVGMSQSVLNKTVSYAKSGKRQGQPLASSEAVQWKLADLAVENNAARLLTYRAIWSKEADKQNFAQYASMCKTYASRVARLHSGEALQILLPLLNDSDSALARFYLDGKMLETFEITNEEEKVLLSSRLGIN